MPNFRIIFGVLTITLIGSHSSAQVNLKWKFNVGDSLHYIIEDSGSTKSGVGVEMSSVNHTLILDTVWRIQSVNSEGCAEVVLTITRARFNGSGKGAAAATRLITFDSQQNNEPESTPEKAIAQVLNALVGPEITLNVNSQGKVTNFDLPRALATMSQENGTKELTGFFGDVFLADGLRRRLTDWLGVLPDEVPLGEQGSTARESDLFVGSVACTEAYAYRGPTERNGQTLEQIDVTRELVLMEDAATAHAERIKCQEGKGTVYFDAGRGRLVESVLRQTLTIQSHMEVELVEMSSVRFVSDR